MYKLLDKFWEGKYRDSFFEGSLEELNAENVLDMYQRFRIWRRANETRQHFQFVNTKFSKQYDWMEMEHADYPIGNEYFIMLYAFDC